MSNRSARGEDCDVIVIGGRDGIGIHIDRTMNVLLSPRGSLWPL
jgi:hypothetical protein